MHWQRDKTHSHQRLNLLPYHLGSRRLRHFLHNKARSSLALPNKVASAGTIPTDLQEKRTQNLFQLRSRSEFCNERVSTSERPPLRERRSNNDRGSRTRILRGTLEEKLLDLELFPTSLSTAHKCHTPRARKREDCVFTKPEIPERSPTSLSWKLYRFQIGHAKQAA